MAYPNLKRLAARYRLVLASRSPRRVMLLREMGVDFDQIIPDVEERRLPGEAPFAYAVRLAEDKGRWAEGCLAEGQIAVACDTIVVLGDKVLEKPTDEADAERILMELSENRHVVCTAVALVDKSGIVASGHETTEVYFNRVTVEQVREYIASGEPMDKAGAYGIQGMGAFLVDRIAGNLDTVIGLPRTLVERLAGEAARKVNLL